MRCTRTASMGLLVAVLAGCATDIEVGTAHDPLLVMPKAATYLWRPLDNYWPEEIEPRRAYFEEQLRLVVGSVLSAKGYTPATSDVGTFVLTSELRVTRSISSTASRAFGQLILTLLEPQGKRVWMRFARTEIHLAQTPEERAAAEERLREIVKRMFEAFPP